MAQVLLDIAQNASIRGKMTAGTLIRAPMSGQQCIQMVALSIAHPQLGSSNRASRNVLDD